MFCKIKIKKHTREILINILQSLKNINMHIPKGITQKIVGWENFKLIFILKKGICLSDVFL